MLDLVDVAGPQPGQRQAWRRAAAIAPGSIRAAGWVPADTAGTVLARRHSAAARCERAELAVHTNSTRGAARDGRGGQRVQRAGDQLQVGAAAVAFGPAAGDDPGLFQHVQVMGEQVGRHGQHGGQLGRRCVPGQQRSVICSRAGSASAAWIAAAGQAKFAQRSLTQS